jgi:hypothetical protein
MLPASFERAFVVGVLVYIAKAGWQFLTGWIG